KENYQTGRTPTPKPHQYITIIKDQRQIKPQRWGKSRAEKLDIPKIRAHLPPAKERSSSPATDQSWTENDFDEMREEGFSPSNFSELKEELRTQSKETKNLEKKVEELM
uniref:Uncharacterized protein n=1 Tax=Macaca fascicularis TaxID=9541 RepID=A0A7N9CRN5_MACFA